MKKIVKEKLNEEDYSPASKLSIISELNYRLNSVCKLFDGDLSEKEIYDTLMDLANELRFLKLRDW